MPTSAGWFCLTAFLWCKITENIRDYTTFQ